MEKSMLEVRDAYEKFVNECKLETPEEVAELFLKYTALIWDYKLVAYCYKFYHKDTWVHRENCQASKGADLAVSGTLGFESSVRGLKLQFDDIFCEEDGKGGYKFCQAVHYVGKCDGPCALGEPSGKQLVEPGKKIFGNCWVDVRKMDGDWKCAEEWLVRDSLGLNEAMTKDEDLDDIFDIVEQED